MLTYEQRLDRDLNWGFLEGSMHFEEKSAVHQTLQKVTRRLEALGVSYAVVDGMALFAHGLRRFTEDVDILVTAEGLRELHTHLEGKGYLPLFTGSKNLRDTEQGVRIEFLITGEFPGDGKPKSVAFPDPSQAAIDIGGIHYLRLPALVEIKLASGMTHPGRLKDLADVQELIRLLALPMDFTKQIDPSVHAKYLELWHSVQMDGN